MASQFFVERVWRYGRRCGLYEAEAFQITEQVKKTSNERLSLSDLLEKRLFVNLIDIYRDWALEHKTVEWFFFLWSIFSFRSINDVKAKRLTSLFQNKNLLGTL